MKANDIKFGAVLIALLAFAVAGRFAGPPALWGRESVCIIQKDGVRVEIKFPVNQLVVTTPWYGLQSDMLQLSVGFGDFTPLPSILDDYQYAIEPMRYAYKPMRFAGFDAAIASDSGLIFRGKWAYNILVPIKSVTVSIDYQSSSEAILPELQAILDSIAISTAADLKPKAECYRPLFPFDIF